MVSVFAIVILSVLAMLYRSGHEEFTGGIEDPADGKAVAGTVFIAVLVYAVRFRISTQPDGHRLHINCSEGS